ncbi:MAG TPA: M28 family peptidase [Gemmatimonadaceae bacterium]
MAAAAALALIERLAATPRAAGSVEERRARALCAELLQESGFETREVPFSYSTLPGRWGVPIVGALWLAAGIAAARDGVRPPGDAPAGIVLPLIIMGWLASLTLGLTVNSGRFRRTGGLNLVATRGRAPAIWLCAHLDTKSQSVPTLKRTVALVVAGATALLLGVLHLGARLADWGGGPVWLAAGIVLASAAAVMVTCFVGNDSPGAADNASGVAAVLAAARSTGEAPLGVILTSAEELGLAGARAWAASAVTRGDAPRLVINCDTLDEEGPMRCVVHRREDVGVARDLITIAGNEGFSARITRHTPGIMVDSAAIAARGIPAVTLSRVTRGTLSRIHTARDTADRLSGEGAVQAAAVMAGFLRRTG